MQPRIIIHFLLMLTVPAMSVGQSQSLETRHAVQMIRGLKARRMFDLADHYGSQRLASESISRLEKITVLNELIRSKVVQAAAQTGSSREQAWIRAHDLARDYLKKDPDHPQTILLQVQDALTYYARGKLIAQEIAAEIQSNDKRDTALEQFRDATRAFAKLEKDIEHQISIARSGASSEGELSAEQLVNLKNNVSYYLARINLARTELYEPDDELNRVDALQQVLSELDALIRQTSPDVPLWWQAQISRIQCLRWMNRGEDADRLLQNLPETELTDELKIDLLTERVLLAADSGKASVNWFAEAKKISRPDPQLSLAVLRWLMASAARADGPGKKELQHRAAQWVAQIENQHGAYWGRRAEILLVDSIKPVEANATDPNLAEGDLQILIRQADNAFRKGNFSDAARTYAKARGFAEQKDNGRDAIYLTVRQALAYENLQKHAEAAEILIEIAKKHTNHADAAQIHLRGCWNFAKTVSADQTRKPLMATHFKQQTELWPAAEASDQARIWLGNHYQNEGQWAEAIDAYLSVNEESSKSLTAAEQISVTKNRWLSTVQDSERPGVARQIGDSIDGKIDFSSATKPVWTEAERSLLLDWIDAGLYSGDLAASVGLNRLQAALEDFDGSDVAWRRKANQRRIVLMLKNDAPVDDLEQSVLQFPSDNRLLKEMILLINESASAEQYQRYAHLLMMICDKAMSDSTENRTFWQLQRARAAIASGQSDRVVGDLQSLASENPASLEIQLAYARILSQLPQRSGEAMKQWRKLAARSRTGADAWYESKFHVIQLMVRDGKIEEARKRVHYLKLTAPAWSESTWARQMERLIQEQ